jgi:hypothetical protein
LHQVDREKESETKMKDKPHKLTPTKNRPFPTVFYFLDTETILEDVGHKTKLHSLKMGICQRFERVTDHEIAFHNEIVIRKTADFIKWLLPQCKSKSHSYIIAHNVVYDATILDLFRELPKHGYKMASIYSKGQVCIVRWAKGDSKITMLDNGNIFSGTLERWGNIFNVPKISIDFDTCTDDELQVYCRRDVEIMVRSWGVWMRFIHENDCGGFRETVGSTAFNTWRHKFLQSEVYVHKEKSVLRLERDGYHGGRVEAFYQGKIEIGQFYYLDINNMYGFVMSNSEFPTGLQGHSSTLGMKRMISYLQRYAVMARVTVNVDVPAFITKVNGFACYPLGRFETVLTTNEIIYALEKGWIESVSEFAWYRKSELFKEYVNEYYRLRIKYRKENNQGFEAICKLLINSLYGKFGQQGIEQTIIGTAKYNEIWHMSIINAQTGKRGTQTALGGIIYEEQTSGESFHSMPAIAAHVTANARLYLLTLIQKAGWENVYYTDTDSLIVNEAGYRHLQDELNENVLGKLKVETQSPWLVVNAPKDYEMEGRKKIKGVRVNAIELSDGIYSQEQWVKLAGLIRQGFTGGYTSKDITKHQQRVIHSGHVSITGRIDPFELP